MYAKTKFLQGPGDVWIAGGFLWKADHRAYVHWLRQNLLIVLTISVAFMFQRIEVNFFDIFRLQSHKQCADTVFKLVRFNNF